MPSQLFSNFFRHEYGKLVASLSRRVGLRYVDEIEDAAQHALMAALEHWSNHPIPENPSGWIYRVALNHLMSELRQRNSRRRILGELARELDSFARGATKSEDESDNELLRLLFVCCDESIPLDSQVVFALKTLCGFDVREIAHRLFSTEATVYKRFSRAKTRLRQLCPMPEALDWVIQGARIPAVQKTLYILFTEGYLSSSPETAIRRELCVEAIRLTTILVEHVAGESSTSCALIALMYFHFARLDSRQSATGGLLLLEEQDRTLWDQDSIDLGLQWLGRSAFGDCFSRFHAEAGIAAEHCLARSFEYIRWDVVADCYAMLERIAPSPVHTLNHAVALAELHGPSAGLSLLKSNEPPSWLAGSYLWSAVMADLHRRNGSREMALRYRKLAIKTAPTEAIQALLSRRLQIET